LKKKGRGIVVCGDVNTAHTEIDLARPKENQKKTGFLPEEREWVSKFINNGYVDTFRHYHKEGGHYTWWDYKTGARQRDIGWRIDYFFLTENLLPKMKNAFIMKDVMGSDHCPIGIELDIKPKNNK
jgi:exodeoxyribonuclease-3